MPKYVIWDFTEINLSDIRTYSPRGRNVDLYQLMCIPEKLANDSNLVIILEMETKNLL